MPLKIKQIENPGLSTLPENGVVPAEIVDTWVDQATILREAKEQLSKTHAEIQSIQEKAHKEGHDKGFAAGRLDGLNFIRMAAISYESARNDLWMQVIDLVDQCVRKLVGDMETHSRVAGVVEQALDAKRDADATIIKVSPELAQELGPTLTYKNASKEHILNVQADPNLDGERCIVMCPRHIVECDIEAQISNLKQTLLAYPPEFESISFEDPPLEGVNLLEDNTSPPLSAPEDVTLSAAPDSSVDVQHATVEVAPEEQSQPEEKIIASEEVLEPDMQEQNPEVQVEVDLEFESEPAPEVEKPDPEEAVDTVLPKDEAQ